MGDFDIVDDEADETLAIEEDELAIEDDGSEADMEEEADDEMYASAAPAASSSKLEFSYTVFLLISLIAYGGALAVILLELQDYTDPTKFLFGFLNR